MTHSWRCAVAVPLTLLGLVALCQANSTPDYKCFKIFSPGIGTIEPRGDIVVEVGSSYEAYCLFNPAKVQVDDVYFKTTGRDRIIPHKVVNDSTISVQVTHNESTNYLLNCWAGNELICQRNVFVGYQPQDVENFTCLSRNWESLNCTWHVPENPVKVTYTLTYVIQDYLSEPRDCPLKEEGKNWCHWSGTHFHSGRQNWTMIITAKNELIEEPVEFRHHVDLYASVIPNMASNFTVDILGPRKAILTWQFPHPIDVFVEGKVTQEVKYRIKPFRNIVRNNPWILVDIWKETPLRFRRKTFNKTIGGLQPYVQYEFSVRLHTGTGPIRENMWSKPALLIRMTQNAQPTVAPLTTLGMFEVEETKLHRDVFVSWQTVDPLEENGPNFTYEVNMFDANDENLVFPSLTTEHCYAKFSRLENNITYRFEIRPRNRRGLPEDPNLKSEVIVPKKAALISIPDYFKVIAYLGNDTTTYMTRWRIPERYRASNNIKSVTLFWCKQTDYENRCQNKLSWEIIDDPFINVKNLTGYDTSSRYIFGISINSHDSSSGIEWSGCIASHGVQQPALEKFNYTYVSSTEVSLKWDLDCKAQAAQPIAFNISYCIVGENGKNCSEPEKYIKVDGESTVQYTVRNLRPYRHYIFNIATISELLGLGKWSRTVHVKTKPSKPSGPPHGIFEISKGQTWISLAWRPPLESEQNGRIIMYDIQFKVKGSQRGSNLEKNVLGHNFTGLEPFTEYHFEVVPCTEVHEGYACGTHAAEIDVKTKIGVPGRIGSIEYDAPWLKWEHEECNGPNCSYELHYTINGTTTSYSTPINHFAVSLRDLNITCPVNQGDIPVRLEAVSTDEEGHRLIGPPKERKISCPSEGSYVIFVPFSISNQYNTNLNLMRIPDTSIASGNYRNPRVHTVSNEVESLGSASLAKPIISMLGSHSERDNNGNYQYPFVHRNMEQIPGDDFSNQELRSDLGNGRQLSQFNSRMKSHRTTDYSQRQSQPYWPLASFTRQNNFILLPVQNLHQANLETRIPSEREDYLRFRLPNTADPVSSDIVSLDNYELHNNDLYGKEQVSTDSYTDQSDNREPSTNSNQNEPSISRYRTVDNGSNAKTSCPLLQLMKAKGVEVLLNASNDNFELKITGKGNLFKLFQNINFPVENLNEAETDLGSEDTVHEMEGNNLPTSSVTLIDNQELQKQDLTDSNKLNISVSLKSIESNSTHQALTHNTPFNHSAANEEVFHRQDFVNEDSNFMKLNLSANGNNSQTNEDVRIPVFVDSVEN